MKSETISELALRIFDASVSKYHEIDKVDQPYKNPYLKDSLEHLLYLKNWIDTVQWHYEDLIRDPNINAAEGMRLKRRIDISNQYRTDVVENIDTFFLEKFKAIRPLPNAMYNSESPAWALDRLSILVLKIFHMSEEVNRTNASLEHARKCKKRLNILESQRQDLAAAIDVLLEDIKKGVKYMKVYKQIKMYNDEELNPILYQQRDK